MNNDLMLVSRETLEQWANDLALHGVGDIDTAKNIDALLAAPAAQAVDEDSRKLHGKLIKLAAGLITGPISTLGDLLDEEKRMTRGRVSIAVDRLDSDIKNAAYEIRQVADALHACTALAAPVQSTDDRIDQLSQIIRDLNEERDELGAECGRLRAELSAPVQSEQEPVGWQFYQDGKWWNGDDRIKDHRVNTEDAGYQTRDVYAAPVWAVMMPECAGVTGALKRVINAARTINFGPQYAKHVAGDDDPQYLQRHEWVEYLLETCNEAEAQLSAQPDGPES